METLKERLLKYYHLNEEDFLAISREPSFNDLPRLDGFPAATKAKNRLLRAAKNHESVLIYGDYDADGILSAAIMLKSLAEIGIKASPFIPSRYLDGYGINLANAKAIAEKGYNLVILVDNGIGAVEEISFLLSKGIDCLVLDHHEFEQVPPSFATLHPSLLSLNNPEISAGGLCFLFSRYLLNRDDEYLATLGALTTLSDCMPLIGYNQKLVALALRILRKNHYPEIDLLCSKSYLNEKIISLEIIPQINAVGRMKETHDGIMIAKYFAGVSEEERAAISQYLGSVNADRKSATKEAESQIRIDENSSGIVVVASLPEGLNGLLANKLLTRYNKPTIVFSSSKSNPDCLVGSARSKSGFDVMELWKSASKLLVKCGGHECAGGATIKKEDFAEFREMFLDFATHHYFKAEVKNLIPLYLDELTFASYSTIRSFGPFGLGYEEPLFCLKNVPTDSIAFLPKANCLKMTSKVDNRVEIFGYGIGQSQIDSRVKYYDFEGRFEINEYRGKILLQFKVDKISPSII